jgi:hypothetical protein
MTPPYMGNLTSAMSTTASAAIGCPTTQQTGVGPYLHFRSDVGTGKFKWIADTPESVEMLFTR